MESCSYHFQGACPITLDSFILKLWIYHPCTCRLVEDSCLFSFQNWGLETQMFLHPWYSLDKTTTWQQMTNDLSVKTHIDMGCFSQNVSCSIDLIIYEVLMYIFWMWFHFYRCRPLHSDLTFNLGGFNNGVPVFMNRCCYQSVHYWRIQIPMIRWYQKLLTCTRPTGTSTRQLQGAGPRSMPWAKPGLWCVRGFLFFLIPVSS